MGFFLFVNMKNMNNIMNVLTSVRIPSDFSNKKVVILDIKVWCVLMNRLTKSVVIKF